MKTSGRDSSLPSCGLLSRFFLRTLAIVFFYWRIWEVRAVSWFSFNRISSTISIFFRDSSFFLFFYI